MTAPALTDKQREVAKLARLRDLLTLFDGVEHLRAQDDLGAMLDSRSRGEVVTIARFSGHATEDEIRLLCDALDYLRFLLGLYDRAARAFRDLRRAAEPERPAPVDTTKDYAAEAAMRCTEPAFKKFLEDKHGLERPLTDERVTQKLRSLLGVTSRRELNEAGAAAERWKALKGDFENWKRTGR